MRRFEGTRAVARILVVWAITAATLHLLSGLLGGLTIAGWAAAFGAAAWIGILGSHGGMGGEQEHAFALVPSELELPAEPLPGSEAVHRQLRRWLADLGHDAYRDGPDVLFAQEAGAREGRA